LKDVYQVLSSTKILVPVISPGGSMIEGVSRGVVPLTYEGSLFDEEARKENFLLPSITATYEDIKNNLERLITDKIFYDRVLASYQKALESHLYRNSRKYFEQLAEFSE
jgi:hypothetical protein